MIHFAYRHRLKLSVAAIAVLVIVVCYQLRPLTSSDLRSSRDIRLILGEGSWRRGFDILIVEGDGKCIYYHHEEKTEEAIKLYHRDINKVYKFIVPESVVCELRAFLVDHDFPNWCSCDGQVIDGDYAIVTVTCGWRRKRVSSRNYCSDNIALVASFVRQQIIAPNLFQMNSGIEIDDKVMLRASDLLK